MLLLFSAISFSFIVSPAVPSSPPVLMLSSLLSDGQRFGLPVEKNEVRFAECGPALERHWSGNLVSPTQCPSMARGCARNPDRNILYNGPPPESS